MIRPAAERYPGVRSLGLLRTKGKRAFARTGPLGLALGLLLLAALPMGAKPTAATKAKTTSPAECGRTFNGDKQADKQADKVRSHFAKAYALLKDDVWLKRDEPKRLARLAELSHD